jgi:ATP-dependent RNA helicase DOB1
LVTIGTSIKKHTETPPKAFLETYNSPHLNFAQKQIKELESERNSMVIEEEESLKDYYDLLQQHRSLKKDVHDIVLSPKHVLPFLQPGRLVRIEYSTDEPANFSIDENVTWGIIINFEKVKSHGEGT